MEKGKSWLTLTVVTALLSSLLAACGGGAAPQTSEEPPAEQSASATSPEQPAEQPAKEAEKPVLKMLIPYQAFDPNTDASALRIQEETGYKVEYYTLPKDNANQKLMLELASGENYDIIKVSNLQFAELLGNGALMELDDLLAANGGNITNAVSEMGWKSATSNGKKYGVPFEGGGDVNDPYGLIQGGIGLRTDLRDELGLATPKTLDEFYTYLKTVKEKKGITPLTASGSDGFNSIIGSAFGLGTAPWYEIDGQLVPRVKTPQYFDYVAFMNKLYQEGLLDKDFPINKFANTMQKFNTAEAATLAPAFFWDIPTLVPAVKENNPNANVEMITALAGASGLPYLSQRMQASTYEVIPKTAKNPEAAMDYMNLRADPDIFLSTYLGEEGTHFEINNGKYFPILPAFDELKNSKQFTGAPKAGSEYKLWQARARKTPEMAASFEQMNANVTKDWIHIDYTGYATSLAEAQKYQTSLNNMETEFLVKAVVETGDLKKAYDDFVAEYDKQGGTELTAAINKWYAENK
ncbi:extracellular solute-binding protein [Paenibacillus antri]|uniref:Extracellular solute-binding protein n=1 Tax=Paenibacillus antri TaxID=2582848 RepID=A0A5R9GF03_9BACL|nr:extracellular solute-binding protein [Paenibacillus antri]TLS51804.1 extracellular solute-binding protein [Paenibacillus antri]